MAFGERVLYTIRDPSMFPQNSILILIDRGGKCMASLCKCRFMLMLSRSALNAAAETAVKQTSKKQLMLGT